VDLVISDGPYALGKGDWDKMGIDGLAEWYAPHVREWSRVCKPSASVYLWNTAEGWARLDPVMRAEGWTFRAPITWDKGIGFLAGKCDVAGARTWPDVTEVCGFYQRDAWKLDTCAGTMIGEAAGTDERNPVTAFISDEREAAGMTKKAMARYFPSRTGGLTGCVANWEIGYNFPTWEVYETMARAMAEHGAPRERPYLVHPSVWPVVDLRASYDHLRASYDHLRASYDHLRAEYEAARCQFNLPEGITNVWSLGQVQGQKRIRGEDGQALHPCQKPLLFATRMIRASCPVGGMVLAPFGGTLREAVACERLPAAEARYYVTCEPERRYIDAVKGSLTFDPGAGLRGGQVGLFGGAE